MGTLSGPYTPISGSALSLDTQNVPDDQTREDSVLMNTMSSDPPAKLDTAYSTLDKRKEYPSIFSIWWQEAGACLLVLAMMAAVVGTTLPHQDKPLPQWPYNLSINTLVAVYFIVLKAAMAFVLSEALGQLKWKWFSDAHPLNHLATYDDASRGPWGAFTLMWQLRGRALLPSLGALAIILSTIIDPFGQQIISFYQCTNLDPVNLNATITRSSFVNAGLGNRIGANVNKLRYDMQNAIHQGFYQAQPLTPPFQCATGTCTFSTKYSNAGWCNKCQDVTDRIVRVEHRRQASNGSFFGNTLTNYTLPLPPGLKPEPFPPNITVRAFPGGTMRVRVFSRDMATTVQVLFGAEDFNSSSSRAHTYAPDAWIRNARGAAECDIYPCTQTYSASVAIGQLNETRESEAAQWGNNIQQRGYRCFGIYHSSIDVGCLNTEEKTALTKAGYKIEPDTTWLAYNFSDFATPNPDVYCWNSTGIYIRPQCIYQLMSPTMMSVQQYFGELFQNTGLNEDILLTNGGAAGAPLPESIFQGGNLSFRSVEALFQRVADSMTMYGRIEGDQSGANNSDPVLGQVWVTNTCVRVRWVWLIYPAVLVVMLFVFFILSVWSVRMGGELARQDYKTSVLPLMFHTVERQGGAGGEGAAMYHDVPGGVLQTKEEIEREARLRVVLGKGEGGWRFKEV